MDKLAGKVALVSGGASGIGKACALRLAQEGAKVVVADIDLALGEQTVTSIVEGGGTASFRTLDVTSEEQWQQCVAATIALYGGLNILVNNAGIAVGGSILTMSLEDWQRQQAVNLDGVFLGTKHSIPAMIDSGHGSVINISSVAGIKGSAHLAAYNATKGGVRLFTKGVARECAANRWPVRVNSVHPGVIETPIWDKMNPELLDAGMNTMDLETMAEQAVPTGLLGKPLDIANGVVFLASDDSSYMTGTELVIDGGLCA
ncbi:MAG: glucose 1-dehydrogenase [Gammaproteobacteria bacterium TMED92]|nr:MAG: glucose 1-dehydrogenase [Gammaproteobacteria bacterium TMED92]